MKLNWGTGIAIFYTIFVISLLSIVILSSRNNVDLVEKEYYQKDINYEKFRKKRENESLLSKGLEVKKNDGNITLHFPGIEKNITGQIHFFRPSNSKLDNIIPIVLDADHNMIISTEKYAKGLWRLMTEWEVNSHSYYNEQKIIL